jgi:hypothetical protein
MPWVGFEPTIPAFERAKTVHASDRAATIIGYIAMHQIVVSKTYDLKKVRKYSSAHDDRRYLDVTSGTYKYFHPSNQNYLLWYVVVSLLYKL